MPGRERLDPAADFLIPAESAGELPGGGSRTLVACADGELSLSVECALSR